MVGWSVIRGMEGGSGECVCVCWCVHAPVGDVAEAEGDGVEVEGAVGEGEALRVALHPRQRLAHPVLCVCLRVLLVLFIHSFYHSL